jgi:hypothetical protein
MEELSTPPILGPIRAEDQRPPRAYAAPRHSEKRPRTASAEMEANDQDEPVENSEPEHHVDISV